MHSRIKTTKISKSAEISSCLPVRPRCSCLSLNEGRREGEACGGRAGSTMKLRAEAKYRERRARFNILVFATVATADAAEDSPLGV